MSTVTVQGYLNGVSYAAVLDDEAETTETRGVMVQAPAEVVAAVEALSGQTGSLTTTGSPATIGLDTIEGALAGLMRATDVTDYSGAAPDHEPEDERPAGPADY